MCAYNCSFKKHFDPHVNDVWFLNVVYGTVKRGPGFSACPVDFENYQYGRSIIVDIILVVLYQENLNKPFERMHLR